MRAGRYTAWALAAALLLGGIPGGTAAPAAFLTASAETEVPSVVYGEGFSSTNVGMNNYSTWSKVVKSYLHQTADGSLERVEYNGGKVIAERLGGNGSTLLDTKEIELPLPVFGGFFAGKDYNFLVVGQDNPNENDDLETVRVLRYSKDWELENSTSVYGSNIYEPFAFGSLRMTETAGKLYVYTCHTMYDIGDGLHHQSNMTFVIDQETMQMTDSYSGIMNIAQAGYVSHSFTQMIRSDGTYVYRVDHGDAHERAVSLTRCEAGGSVTNVIYTLPLPITGRSGDNATGVSVGGFELSADNCLIAGNSVDMDEAVYSSSGQRNIFVTVTDKGLSGTATKWFTSYKDGDSMTVRTPHLTALGNDTYLLMWEEKSGKSSDYDWFYTLDTDTVTTRAVMIDGSGNALTEIASLPVRLSDCEPIADSSGLVRWYVTSGDAPVYYAIDPADPRVDIPAEQVTSLTPKERLYFLADDETPLTSENLIDAAALKDGDADLTLFGFGRTASDGAEELTPAALYTPGQQQYSLYAYYNGKPAELPAVTVRIGSRGDVDGSGTADAADANEILVFVARKGAGYQAAFDPDGDAEQEAFTRYLADVDGSSSIDAADAADILIRAAKMGAGMLTE